LKISPKKIDITLIKSENSIKIAIQYSDQKINSINICEIIRLPIIFDVLSKLTLSTRIPLKTLPKKIDTILIKLKNVAEIAI
jgi:hypothetical protein